MTTFAALAVRRGTQRLTPDRARVITRMFVPGQEGFDHQDSRTAAVVARALALDDNEVDSTLDKVMASFRGWHRDLIGTFNEHAAAVADRLDPGSDLSDARRLLLGATFTSEFAVEGAALCNPSMVAHPDQSDLPVVSLAGIAGVGVVIVRILVIGHGSNSSSPETRGNSFA